MTSCSLQTFQGNRLVLRPFSESDITSDYIGWLNDPEVVRFSNQRFKHHDVASCQAYLSSFTDSPNLFLAMIEIGSNQLIGTMTVYRSVHHETADIGIMIGKRSVWGRGYGKEAFSLLVTALLGTQGIRKITAGCLSCNVGMVEVMKYAGLHLEATRRAQEIVDGNPEDVVYYARF
jgi:ribosomal-protein-alanine N-acetyltransferase